MKNNLWISIGCLLMAVLYSSCISHEKLVNYNSDFPVFDTTTIQYVPAIILQSNDILDIKVHSLDEKIAAPFNLIPIAATAAGANVEALQLNGYLIDPNGYIDFPVIGRIKASGMSIEQLRNKLFSEINTYIKDPVINIRLLNFRITVSGEVNNPGSFQIISERITLPEMISLAGDFTNYANREDILLVREQDGKRSFTRINMLSADVFQSDFYYLRQNDYIYIEPLKAKVGSIRDQADKTISFSSALIAIAAFVIGITR